MQSSIFFHFYLFLKVTFQEVIAEPEPSVFSLDKIWVLSFKVKIIFSFNTDFVNIQFIQVNDICKSLLTLSFLL